MALALTQDFVDGNVLTEAQLETEFNNIYNNPMSLISPMTSNLAAGGFSLTGLALGTVASPSLQYTGDTNTGWYSSAADTVNAATGGVLAAQFGASFILAAAPEDARTATVDVVGILRSTTSGVPAASIGVGLEFDCESADENPSVFGRIDFAASDITAASEDTYMDILLRVAGVAAETKYRFTSTAATGFQLDFAHAVTVDRTITFPDRTGTVATAAGNASLEVTSAAPATPTANTLYADLIVKGWVETSGAGLWTIDADVNVSSITDNAAGEFTINWATAFANANYAVMGQIIGISNSLVIFEDPATAKTASLVRMQVRAGATPTDPPTGVSVLAIGL